MEEAKWGRKEKKKKKKKVFILHRLSFPLFLLHVCLLNATYRNLCLSFPLMLVLFSFFAFLPFSSTTPFVIGIWKFQKLLRKEKKIPPRNWYSTIAEESFSMYPGLASVSLAPASDSLVFPNYTQNHESESTWNQTCTRLEETYRIQQCSRFYLLYY